MNKEIPADAVKDHEFYEVTCEKSIDKLWPFGKSVFKCKKCNIILIFNFELTYIKNIKAAGFAIKQNWYYDHDVRGGLSWLSWVESFELQKYSCDELIIKDIIE